MSKDPSVLLLEHHLKALKLPTLLRDYCSAAQKSLKWEAGECMVGWELSGRVPSIT